MAAGEVVSYGDVGAMAGGNYFALGVPGAVTQLPVSPQRLKALMAR
jgi:alkylated DNA nucleotide flippase Atl1